MNGWSDAYAPDDRLRIEMTFADVAHTIGKQLPRSAYRHPAWQANDLKHTQARGFGDVADGARDSGASTSSKETT